MYTSTVSTRDRGILGYLNFQITDFQNIVLNNHGITKYPKFCIFFWSIQWFCTKKGGLRSFPMLFQPRCRHFHLKTSGFPRISGSQSRRWETTFRLPMEILYIHMGVEPKIGVGPPNHPFVHRVFHKKNIHFGVFYPIFGNTHIITVAFY